MDEQQPAAPEPRARRWVRPVLLNVITLMALLVSGIAIVSEQYQGPRDLKSLTMVMPGVPLFPLSDMAAHNRATQRALAIPLLLMRLQGARQAEAALLQAPADREFVLEWYRLMLPSQSWKPVQEAPTHNGTRLLYLRGREAVQIVVGPTPDGLHTPVQIMYLAGLSDRQIIGLHARHGAERR